MMLLPAITQTRGTLDSLLNKIHHADALDLLRRLPDASIDMVLCDLPYGTLSHIGWDNIIPFDLMWREINRIVMPDSAIVLTCSEPFASALVLSNYNQFRHEWIWQKPQGTGYLNANRAPMKNHELIKVFSEKAPRYYPQMREGDAYVTTSGDVGGFVRDKSVGGYLTVNSGWRYPLTVLNYESETGLHPTQKPVALFEYLIKTYTQAGEIVLDMTCGSGTTAIAARKTGRQFICGDLSAEYVEVARKRLQNTDPYQSTILPDGTKQLSLFENIS